MDINSSLSSGLQGFQNATELAYEAASNIAKQTAGEEFSFQQATQKPTTVDLGANAGNLSFSTHNNTVSINQSIVDLKVAQHQAKASVAVIKTADETLGTLIDVSV